MAGAYPVKPEKRGSTGAIVALVFGILSIALFWFPVLGFIFELVAIILGKISNKECFSNAKLAKAGFVMGIIALILGIIIIAIGLGAGAAVQTYESLPWYQRLFGKYR